jgi:hypothetical protein
MAPRYKLVINEFVGHAEECDPKRHSEYRELIVRRGCVG